MHVFTHIILLRGESSHAHARRVRFDHAVDSTDVWGRHAEAGADPAHSAVWGRHKRIRPWEEKRFNQGKNGLDSHQQNIRLLTEVDIQESGVGPLHQDLLTGPGQSFVHEIHAISDQRTQSLCKSLQEKKSFLSLL